MKLLIAGSRSIHDEHALATALDEAMRIWDEPHVDEIVSGGARGIDQLAVTWARLVGLPVRLFRPDYARDGYYAPLVRNVLMARYAHALVAIWDGKSGGTAHMIGEMQRRQKPVFISRVES